MNPGLNTCEFAMDTVPTPETAGVPLLRSYTLTLGGQRRIVVPGDEAAAGVVDRLAAAMRLRAAGSADSRGAVASGRRVCVLSHGHPAPPGAEQAPACVLRPSRQEDALFCHFLDVSLALARDMRDQGAMLVHGALAERGGKGVLLCAPGGVGKTTASRRLPPPWVSLCDDTTLLRPGGTGAFRAHPWPTWSNFLPGGPGGRWNVQYSVPLAGIYFLARATDDRAERLGSGRALAMLADATQQAMRVMERGLSDDEVRASRLERFGHLCAMAKTVPAFRLHISLNGTFWECLDWLGCRHKEKSWMR